MSTTAPRVIALLPMKANSERVKGKNFRNFNGRPLFSWVLETLLSVDEISQVVINTDARHILADNGLVGNDRILIRDRKPEICGDFVSMNLVLADDIANVPGDIYVMTHTTNPLLTAETVRKALVLQKSGMDSGDHDSVFTVNKHQTRFYRDDMSAVNHDPKNLIRTQDLEPWFEENSNLFVFSGSSFSAANARIGLRPVMLEQRKTESIDIDDAESWEMAEAMSMYTSQMGASK